MALGLIPDLVGSFFGGKEKGGDTVNTAPQWLLDLQQQLAGVVGGGLKNYTPGAAYTGDLNFSGTPTSQEKSSLDQLTALLGQPGTGSLFDQASGQVSDTLSGKFADPASSPFIQAMTKLAQNNLGDQITQERGTRGARGTYYTDAGIQAEGKLRGRTMDTLNGLIGQFIQQERQNQLTAAPLAQNLDQYKNLTLPLAKIQAGQQYGSLSRTIQQANLESQYQDYLRQRTELGNNMNTAYGLSVNQQNITPGTLTTPKYFAKNDLGNALDVIDSQLQQVTGGANGGNSGGMQQLLKLLAGSVG